ncbi:MAG TPA: tRNA (adenosine(37)-N6)-dimethylallyltransferase MiaA [Phenylobacterium sp.]|jgi:tRNA dimethylallyltransferase|uniref:tRNA (adenosine(37)-N6)-dimethylallyltransferase MiaA n=1 Tax=Phenylobacterium sp. TaxID=1871053 RepID=UPI002C3F593A|nr:tRNA (adenosine(37)-N6)-dimethylallyltransferase MiaA [Phenylobacterium sp.]HXA39682.1 tRNA (adenosine(37)-N6)-dimethylallyltransferase MiaA [Phenylobacterium sp.]
MAPRIWLIAGPTASGKSALALRLAEATGAEIVGADSMQLYADLRQLTARPSPKDEARRPHHLFGTVDAADAWSVGRWLRAAHEALAAIAARGRPAVVVGGTGLYFRALTRGLAEAPEIPPEVRRQTAADYDALGHDAFRDRLAGADRAAAARIEVNDRQRLSRAWEVFAATGRPLTAWQADNALALPAGAWSAIALEPPREALYARCDARLAAMLETGVLDEVAAFAARGLDPALPLMKAVGFRELAAHLRGEASLLDALAAAQQQTRNYAKRQTTWMRGQMAGWPRLTEIDPEGQWGQFLALNPALTP